MKKHVRMLALGLMVWGGFTVCAEAQAVSNVKARQRSPWNNKVDIDYTISGVGDPSGYSVRIEARAQNGTTRPVSTSASAANGAHRVTWDPANDGGAFASPIVTFTVSLYKSGGGDNPGGGDVVVEPGSYLVIDLQNGATRTLNQIPAGGWDDTYKTTSMALRRIPAGTYTMGSPANEVGRAAGETQHSVTLSQDYYMGVFEVTQKQWELVMKSGNPSDAISPTHPVEQVSYDMIRGASSGKGWPANSNVDTDSFIGKLRSMTGIRTFDLPTEAQWEHACRAGTTSALNNGANLVAGARPSAALDKLACYENNYETTILSTYPNQYSPSRTPGTKDHKVVGSYSPNAWGLYDMHGNVSEWCLDWTGSYGNDPKGPSTGWERIVRGGCWYDYPPACRSAARSTQSPSCKSLSVGFRVSGTASSAQAMSLSAPAPRALATETLCGSASASTAMGVYNGSLTVNKGDSLQLTYSDFWDGSKGGSVTILADNQTLCTKAGEGVYTWTATAPGTSTVTLTQKDGGATTATLLVTVNVPVTPSDPPAEQPVVKAVQARQRYPWNNLVDIDYEIGGVSDATGLSVTISANDGQATYPVTSLSPAASAANGTHRVTWDPAADNVPALVSGQVVFTVSLRKGGDEPGGGGDIPGGDVDVEAGSYLVIDLASGAKSTLTAVPGGSWSDSYKTDKLVLRGISKGSFQMGSPLSETGRYANESRRQTSIGTDFYMGVFEITQAQWKKLMGSDPSYAKGDKNPVERVSYQDALSFITALNTKAGVTFALPTEAQWEYACRAGKTSALNNGQDLAGKYADAGLGALARYQSDYASGTTTGHAAVGSFSPNAWGLYDMHGNVAEWCGDSIGSDRAVRGGCWYDYPRDCRSAARSSRCPTAKSLGQGFRLVANGAVAPAVLRSASIAPLAGATAEIVSTKDSAAVRMDLRSGTRTVSAGDTVELAYSDRWNGTPGGNVSVAVQNGSSLFNGQGEGLCSWIPASAGTFTLVHTYSGMPLTATFHVVAGQSGYTDPTQTTIPVPYSWLEDQGLVAPGSAAQAYDNAANENGLNGIPVWKNYLIGLDPNGTEARFTVTITMKNGRPEVTWTPDLGAKRVYAVEGKAKLTDSNWDVVPDPNRDPVHRFFRVKVDLPAK